MKTFKANKARFRASFTAAELVGAHLGKIDKENEILHDVQITCEGEAKGHGIYLDREFCDAVAEQGNALTQGVKVRFGHPAMCSDALGTYLGRATNFRVVELTRTSGENASAVVADVKLAAEAHQAPSGDLAAWVLAAAENSPDTFGQSIVFTYSDWVVKDADGNRHSYVEECHCDDDAKRKSYDQWLAQSVDGKEYAVLGKLLGTDFTDTPAATDGVFSSDSLAAEAEALLEENPQIAEVLNTHPENAIEFLKRVGLFEKIESARVAGLQAAKDKEIAALQEALTARREDIAELEVSHADDISKLNEKITALESDLASARSDVERLTQESSEAAEALAREREQLQSLRTKHAELTGAALNPVHPQKKQFASWSAAVDALGFEGACRDYPEMRPAISRKSH